MELGRINVAARGVGIAQAALDESLRYAQVRKTFGQPIAQHTAIQLKLADMATRTEAARLLVHRAAEMYNHGDRCDMEAGMAKLFATEAALENATEAMRVHGGYGYSAEFTVERLYRDAPLLVIGEGTNELQRIIIARRLVAGIQCDAAAFGCAHSSGGTIRRGTVRLDAACRHGRGDQDREPDGRRRRQPIGGAVTFLETTTAISSRRSIATSAPSR